MAEFNGADNADYPGWSPLVDWEGAQRMLRSNQKRQFGSALFLEGLEARLLLSLYTGPSSVKPIVTKSAIYQATVTGGGFERIHKSGNGSYSVRLVGTTAASTFSINVLHTRPHFTVAPLGISQITVVSNQLGAIQALGTGNLLGPVSTIENSVSTIQFANIGPNAKIDVLGDLGGLHVAGIVSLNPSGHINVGGNVTGPLKVDGRLVLNGGQINVGNSDSGGINVGALTIQNGGALNVRNSLTGAFRVSGPLQLQTNGAINIGGSLDRLTVQGFTADSGGNFRTGGDITGAVTITGGMNLAGGAAFSVGRDALGGITVGGDLVLDSGANVSIGRALNGLKVNGNLVVTPTGGAITVGGDLNNLVVTGAFSGKGTTTADLNVGLNLAGFTVRGGGAGQGGLQGVNINVAKNITQLNIQHGIFNSFITAGVLINGGAPNATTGGNIGADGTDAIFNSEIRAGSQINDLIINGDVRSDFPTNSNPTGFPTRIIAGENRDGVFAPSGLIDHFQILGALIDSAIAASVQPYGGNGTLPPVGYNPTPPIPNPGPPTYNEPRGTVAVGTFASSVNVPNYTPLSYYNETLTGVHWGTTYPINNKILSGGLINPSFATSPAINSSIEVTNNSGSATSGSQTIQTVPAPLAIPTTSTVLGGVISTQHTNAFDFAGLFASDTSGVFIGPIPRQKGS